MLSLPVRGRTLIFAWLVVLWLYAVLLLTVSSGLTWALLLARMRPLDWGVAGTVLTCHLLDTALQFPRIILLLTATSLVLAAIQSRHVLPLPAAAATLVVAAVAILAGGLPSLVLPLSVFVEPPCRASLLIVHPAALHAAAAFIVVPVIAWLTAVLWERYVEV